MRFLLRRRRTFVPPRSERPDPNPVAGGPWVRVRNGVNVTDRLNPAYARWLVGKIQESAPFAHFQVVDSDGGDITEEYL